MTTHHRRTEVAFCALLLLFGAPAAAQQRPSPTRSFVIEALGGAAGSAAGIGLGTLALRPGNCDGEDVACILEKLGSIGLITAVTSPLGAWSAGTAADTKPALAGAVAGGIVGVLAGVGVIRLLDEAGTPVEGAGAVLLYSATQGVVTALGSRLLRSVRDGR